MSRTMDGEHGGEGGCVVTLAGGASGHGFADGVGMAAAFANPTDCAVDPVSVSSWRVAYQQQVLRGAALCCVLQEKPHATVHGAWCMAHAGSRCCCGATQTRAPPCIFLLVEAARTSNGCLAIPLPCLHLPGLDPQCLSRVSLLRPKGTVYVADSENHRIRAVDPLTGATTTVAGTDEKGHKDGPCAEALFNEPTGVAVDSHGRIYVCDRGNHRIRVIDNGGVRTLAGSGVHGYLDGAASVNHTL